MQDPTPHQTDIESVIHQDEVDTPHYIVASVSNGKSNGNGNGKSNGNGKVKVPGPDVPTPGRLNNAPGLKMERRFTQPGVNVYDTVTWELRDAVISNERGEKVFEQKNVEIPSTWTQLATNVVVSKYFRGHIGTPQREHSVRQLISRVADTMANWGRAMDYFATEEDAQTFQDELTHILLYQKAAFNSPVWFNVGLPDQPRPQSSACFINSVEDTMESILTLAKTEGMLFKFGSGTGTNLSTIRGSREPLEGGGTASGPISFMRGFDQFAGAIKSGGKTRRAAKMVILNIDHPDIPDFITCKATEEKKAWALIDAGYNGSFNVPGGAYDSVSFQNANHSIRVTDEFMQAVEQDADWQTRSILSQKPTGTYKARELMKSIGESAWICGDPGMQYDTVINKWHTCKNTDRIHASNPCCITGDTLIAVADGRNAVPIKELVGTETPVYAHDHATGQTTVSRMWNIGVKRESAPIYRVTLDDGSSFRATDDHLIMQRDGSYKMVRELKAGDSLMPFHSKVLASAETRTKRRFYWSGRSWQPQDNLENWGSLRPLALALGANRVPTVATVAHHFADDNALREEAALFNHKVLSVEFCGHEDVYDGTVDEHHNFAILTSNDTSCVPGEQNYSGIFIHNSEYMFLNDSACNLASLNLMKFRRADHSFDTEEFKHACRIVLTAQEIIVDNASYPTPRIGENSHDYRPLGLGYANLGALLMASGLAYDSDEGRAVAGAITAIMTGEAYYQSSIIARDHGWTFPGYAKNREPFLDVMRMHRAAVDDIDSKLVSPELLDAARTSWDNAVNSGVINGYRNAQSTVLAPTGTIGFLMDCDTTGIEPDIAIVKYKSLVGGGMMKIVNNTVPEALQRLGYTAQQCTDILAYIDKNDTIEGAPELKPEHLSIFDCAFKPGNGVRSIHYMGHIRMMAAAQPFISGAISKTVNMPHEATAEEIMGTYMEGWKLGLKAIAIYRDGSKRTQPLMTKKADEPAKEIAAVAPAPASVPAVEVKRPNRRKLPDERASITHKFSIAGHEGYITVGMYQDGTPGEIFLTMSKEGSTISGLMDAFATAISLALQYGVPLQTLVDKFGHTRFEPSGITNNPDIRFAKSIMDYIFRWLGSKFLNREPEVEPSLSYGQNEEGGTAALAERPTSALTLSAPARTLLEQEKETFQNQADAPICTECGSLMVRNGACFKCLNCGSVFGCS